MGSAQMDDVVSTLKLLDLPPHVLKMTMKDFIEAGAQVVPEIEVQENIDDAAASGGMEVTEIKAASMEAAPHHPGDGSELDIESEPGEGAHIEAVLKEGLAALPATPNQEGRVAIEQQHEGCDGSPAGNDNATQLGQKDRKKRKNWTDPEDTDKLLEAVSTKKKNVGSTRMDKCNAASELAYWDAIAEEVPGRTGDECRMRVDTLKKSYKKIKKFRDDPQKDFKEPSPRLTEDWYNLIRDHCPPKPKKNLRAGSSSMSRGPSLGLLPPTPTDASSSKGTLNERLDAGSSKVVIRTPDAIDPSNSTLAELEQVAIVAQTFSSGLWAMDGEGPPDPPPSPQSDWKHIWHVGEQAEPADWAAPDLFPFENQLQRDDMAAESDSEFGDLSNNNA